MTAPTVVASFDAGWGSSSSPKATTSFATLVGDILVAYSIVEDAATINVSSPAGGVTWTAQQVSTTGTHLRAWTGVVTAAGNKTVSFAEAANTSLWWGGGVIQFRNSDGVGNTALSDTNTGTPSLNITTQSDDSAIVLVNGDWNALSGTSRNFITSGAGTFTETAYFNNTSRYTAYAGYYANAGVAGSQLVGMTAPSGQDYSLAAIEIRGTASAPPVSSVQGSFPVTVDIDGTLTVPVATVPQIQGDFDVTVDIDGTLSVPPATPPQVQGDFDVTVDLDATLSVPTATVLQLEGDLDVTIDIDATLSVPTASVPQLQGDFDVTVDIDGTLSVPTGSIPVLQGDFDVTIDIDATLSVPTASIPQIQGDFDVTVDIDGTLSVPAASVPELQSDFDVTIDIDATLSVPTATVPQLQGSFDVEVNLVGSLALPFNGVIVGSRVGDITGPAKAERSVSNASTPRETSGAYLSRKFTGITKYAGEISGASVGISPEPDGPSLSRLVSPHAASRNLSEPGV